MAIAQHRTAAICAEAAKPLHWFARSYNPFAGFSGRAARSAMSAALVQGRAHSFDDGGRNRGAAPCSAQECARWWKENLCKWALWQNAIRRAQERRFLTIADVTSRYYLFDSLHLALVREWGGCLHPTVIPASATKMSFPYRCPSQRGLSRTRLSRSTARPNAEAVTRPHIP